MTAVTVNNLVLAALLNYNDEGHTRITHVGTMAVWEFPDTENVHELIEDYGKDEMYWEVNPDKFIQKYMHVRKEMFEYLTEHGVAPPRGK